MFKFIASIGILGGLVACCGAILIIMAFFYGIYLSFAASIIFGIIVLFLTLCSYGIVATIFGLVMMAFSYNIPEHLVRLFTGN